MEKLRIFWIGDAVMAGEITLGVQSYKRARPVIRVNVGKNAHARRMAGHDDDVGIKN
jgi:hypothetical protein